MPKYQVEIDARNFLVELDGTVGKHGFVTILYVEAVDAKAAEYAAVQMLRDDQELRSLVKNDKTDPPTMDVTEVIEVESFDGIDGQPGKVWYKMKAKRWWQFSR